MNKSIPTLTALALAWTLNIALANDVCKAQEEVLTKAKQAIPEACDRMPWLKANRFIFEWADDIQVGINCYSAQVAAINALEVRANCIIDSGNIEYWDNPSDAREGVAASAHNMRGNLNNALRALNLWVPGAEDCTTVIVDWNLAANTVWNCPEEVK